MVKMKEKSMNSQHVSKRLTEDQGRILIRLARVTMAARLGIADAMDEKISTHELADPVFQEKRGTFVTLKISNQLRGCIGCLTPSESILEGVQRNAVNAAFNDPRFPPLTGPELAEAEIEISILTSPQKLAYSSGNDLLEKLRPGIDGVIISKGMAQATFLPQVWEQLPRTEDFLRHLCLKAGLSPAEWLQGDLDVSLYQVQYFHENG
jgi:AmmeMemoRadiSam system protein A